MRDHRKLTISVLLILAICCGCGAPAGPTGPTPPPYTQPTPPTFTEPSIDPVEQAYLDAPQDYVVFSPGTDDSELYLPLEELLRYESRFPDCSGTWFRDQLEGEKLSIYQAYLYALENYYTEFAMYTQGKEEEYHDIRQLVALDSPLLEQNYSSSEEEIFTWPAKFTGTETEFRMPLCTLERWQQRMVALEQCRKIVANIPPELTTQLEKMEYLYDYVCDHVEYIDYGDIEDPEYLYDAVCEGKTNCDGYTNMLALLFHLIGVECCEISAYPSDPDLFDPGPVLPDETEPTTPEETDPQQTQPEEDEEDSNVLIGHTWVCAWVDGVPFHFDATYDDTKKEFPLDENIYFGFSDHMIGMDFLCYQEMLPQCTDTSLEHPYADLVVQDITTTANIKKIARLSEQRANSKNYETLVVVWEDFDNKQLKQLLERFGDYVDDISSIAGRAVTYGDFTLLWLTAKPW